VAAHDFDEIVGHLTPCVEALVDDCALLLRLRKVVAIEVREAAFACVRQIDVRELSAGEFVNLLLVAFDPIDIAQCGLACDWSYGDVAGAFSFGGCNAETDDVAGGSFERLRRWRQGLGR